MTPRELAEIPPPMDPAEERATITTEQWLEMVDLLEETAGTVLRIGEVVVDKYGGHPTAGATLLMERAREFAKRARRLEAQRRRDAQRQGQEPR